MKRLIFIVSLALVVGFFINVIPSFSKPLVLRWSQTGPDSGVQKVYSDWFAQELEKRTMGRVKIQIYWGNTLVPLRESADGIKAGVADMGWVAHAYHPNVCSMLDIAPPAGFFSIHPSMVTSTEKWLKFMDQATPLW